MTPTQNPIEAARTEERLERIEGELEELNCRLDAIIEAVRLLAPQHYSPPWSDNRLMDELHRADTAGASQHTRQNLDLIQFDDRR